VKPGLVRPLVIGGLIGCGMLSAVPTCRADDDAPVWSAVYQDDFDGPLAQRWTKYTGRPKSDPRARWDPAKVRVAGGALVLDGAPTRDKAGTWATGGVSNSADPMTYGRWQIRYRATPSSVLSYHFLLWPRSERWPPEIDIAEGFVADRSRVDAFVHWVDAGGVRRKEQRQLPVHADRWDVVGLEWSPDAVVFTRNGRPWARITGDAVPHEPMWLALQTETQVCRPGARCPYDPAAPPRVEIDWVKVDAYRG
jgi:hypothetical protein